MMNRRQLYWGNIITTRNVLAGVSVSEAGPQPGTGKPGQLPPGNFCKHDGICSLHEKIFLETVLPLRKRLPKTTFLHTYVLRHIG